MKAAIYCRLSEEDKNKKSETDDSNSIRNQKAMLQQYSAEQGWEIYRIYSDDDYTGADRKRPEFNRLLEDARAHRFDIVLCKTQSRFTRELELVEKYIHGLFPLWGIRFVSVVDNADTDNRGNKKSRQINGLVNEWYLEDMSENIKSVLTNRRLNGFHIGSFALYGYQKDPLRKGHLIIDEESAAVVREVFTLFSQGYGKTAIARLLNDRGIPNPTEYKRLKGMRYSQPETKNSTLWKYPAISSMLANEIYIGNMVQGKYGSISYKTKQNKPRPKSEWYIVEGTHEPIIDRDLWNRVQDMAARRTKPFCTGEIGLFAGKAHCANCGYTMRSAKKGDKRYLQCPTRHVSKNSCAGAFVSVERLEEMILEELNRLIGEYLDKDLLKASIVHLMSDNHSGVQKEQLTTELSLCKQKQEEYTRGLLLLYTDKARNLLPEQDFSEMVREFISKKERLARRIDKAERQLAMMGTEETIKRENPAADGLQDTPYPCTRLTHLNRETVETLIESIIVGRRIPGTRDIPIEIHWNF